MPSNESRGPRQIARAAVWSYQGLRAAWTHEASFRLEGYLFVVCFPLGLWLGQGRSRQGQPGVPRACRTCQGHGLGGGFRAHAQCHAVLGPCSMASILLNSGAA